MCSSMLCTYSDRSSVEQCQFHLTHAPWQFLRYPANPFVAVLVLIGALAKLYVALARTRFLWEGTVRKVGSSLFSGSCLPLFKCLALARPRSHCQRSYNILRRLSLLASKLASLLVQQLPLTLSSPCYSSHIGVSWHLQYSPPRMCFMFIKMWHMSWYM